MFFGEHRKMPVGIKRKAAHERNHHHFVRHGKVYNLTICSMSGCPTSISPILAAYGTGHRRYLANSLRPIRFPRCIRLPWTARARPPTRFLTR